MSEFPPPIDAAAIRAVAESEDDFGFELRVSAAFQALAVRFEHAGTYVDRATNKPRQYDFRCTLRQENTKVCETLRMAVECKNLSLQSPLVVCGTARRSEESFHRLIKSVGKVGWDIRKTSGRSEFYPPRQFVGKSLFRPAWAAREKTWKSAGDSEIYEKWAQAIASLADLVDAACSAGGAPTDPPEVSALLPIVVVPDGALWWAAFDESTGTLLCEPQQADERSFYIDRAVRTGTSAKQGTFRISHIHFMTLSGLKRIFVALRPRMPELSDNSLWEGLFAADTPCEE